MIDTLIFFSNTDKKLTVTKLMTLIKNKLLISVQL